MMNKHSSLKKVYYASFLSMVVIPILLVFFISLSVIRAMMQNSAVSAIQSAQNAASSSLTERVRDASLQLSHFVYVNNNEIMELAAMTDTSDVSQRYKYSSELDKLFQVAMAPKQAVISGMVYMKDGRYTYLKQEVSLNTREVKATAWYQRALEERNMVSVGSYDTARTKVTYSGMKRNEMILAVALSPDNYTDRSGKIDSIVLFFQTEIGDILEANAKNPKLGKTVILDENNEVIFGNSQDKALTECLDALGDVTVGTYNLRRGKVTLPSTCVVTKVPDTGWRIFSYVHNAEITGDFNKIAGIMLAVTAGLFLLYYLFSQIFLRGIIKPVHVMVEGLKQVEEGNLDIHIEPDGQHEIRQMIHSFNEMARELKQSVNDREVAQQKKLDAEVRALQSQINPHFLVNTLNSIRFMAQVSKFDGIRKMAEALIQILTCSFRSNSSFYTVKEELDVLDSYLYLMKIRYSDGFDVEYQIDDECKEYELPRLTLQPVVENSIVHGFTDMEENFGHLQISAKREAEQLVLEVKDNGKGMTEEEISQILNPKEREPDDNYNIGIENVYSRLKLHFGENCELTIESEPGAYTRTVIRLPVIAGKRGE